MTQTISIRTHRGPRYIEARPVGPFFVHPTFYDGEVRPDDYTVTHAFTGYAIAYHVTEEEAERIAQQLPELDNWYIGWLDAPIRDFTQNSVAWLWARDIEPAASKA